MLGSIPDRRLPQAGITDAGFPDVKKKYYEVAEERVKESLTSIVSEQGEAVEKGVIDRTVDFMERNMVSVAWIDGGRRRQRSAFPLEAVREAIVKRSGSSRLHARWY